MHTLNNTCRLVLAQNKKELLTNWWNEGKLEASEELGDLVSTAGDKDMALKIFQQCGASGKVRRVCCRGCVWTHFQAVRGRGLQGLALHDFLDCSCVAAGTLAAAL